MCSFHLYSKSKVYHISKTLTKYTQQEKKGRYLTQSYDKSLYTNRKLRNRCLWNTYAPFPNISRKAWLLTLTFHLLTWILIGGHLHIKDYLPTKFEASWAKRSWVISCTRCRRSTLTLTSTFDLPTWISIGINYSSLTIYLPSLKLVGQSVLELSVAQGEVYWHDLWPWPLTYVPEYQ